MNVESLEQLSAAFGDWRTGKRHVREKMPDELLRRARRAAKVYGVNRVARRVKVDGRLLQMPQTAGREETGLSPAAPLSYSRVELVRAAATSARPFAELEMPSGLKLRLYSDTREAFDLLASVCSSGGKR